MPTINTEAGVYAYSGDIQKSVITDAIAGDVGSYAYTGDTQDGTKSDIVSGDVGSFAYVGGEHTSSLPAEVAAGAYSYTGGAADLFWDVDVVGDVGVFGYTGSDVSGTPDIGIIFSTDAGTYSYSGGTLSTDISLGVVAGTYSYSGAAALNTDTQFSLDVRAYDYIGGETTGGSSPNDYRIDGATSVLINTNYQSKTLYCGPDGDWFTID